MKALLGRLFRPEEPPTLTIQHEGRSHAIDLRRSRAARRVTLRVSGTDGRITLTLPPNASMATARAFVARQQDWIATRLSAIPRPIPFRPGERVPIRGVPHLIVGTGPGRGAALGLTEGGPVLAVAGDADAIPGRIRRFLVTEAGRDLRGAVNLYTNWLATPARRITVRDTKSRWGSCSSSGTLNFSWRLILAPPFVLDYLAAHEVAHLRELNHSDRFWSLLRDLCPETDAAERWLKRHGAELHRYG